MVLEKSLKSPGILSRKVCGNPDLRLKGEQLVGDTLGVRRLTCVGLHLPQEALAEEKQMQARFLNDIAISKAQRDFQLKKASYDMEVQTSKAQADMAYELQVGGLGLHC